MSTDDTRGAGSDAAHATTVNGVVVSCVCGWSRTYSDPRQAESFADTHPRTVEMMEANRG